MKAKGLKDFLNSLVEPQYQTFDVRFLPGTKKGPLGTYLRKTRLITIYPNKFQSRFELLGTGLHELAHHLSWGCETRTDGSSLTERKPGSRSHGKEFVHRLKQLTQTFNLRHGERLKGFMFCSSRNPSRSPGFVKFSELDYRIDPADCAFAVPEMPGYAKDNTSKITRGQRVVLIGFNRRKEAFMYSRRTRKFDYKISTGWLKLLCNYAVATPKPGELWEFGVLAKRILDASGKRVG